MCNLSRGWSPPEEHVELFEKLVGAKEGGYEYYVISVRSSLRPENTEIQDISDVADVLEAQDELSFDPENTDSDIPV